MANDLIKASDVAIAGQVSRQEFGGREVELRGETASEASAAREQALVNAQYIMAERHPRNIEVFRQQILDECKRPGFASVARYGKPVGGKNPDGTLKKVYGPSIRFIEAAIRCFRNISPQVFTVYDSPLLRIVKVAVTDLESNIPYSNEIQIEKKVERKGFKDKGGKSQPPEGRTVFSERLNSYGDTVYIVSATEDEVLIKQAALVSKSIRTQAQRLLPGDIVEESMALVIATQEASDKSDPAAALRKLTDAFHSLHIEITDLEQWAGKSIDKLQPKQIQDLREIFTAVKEGEVTWEEIMAPIVAGDAEQQKEVGLKKVADLLKKKESPKESPRDGTATVNTGGEPTTAKAETSTQPEQPVVEEPAKESGSPAPEKTGGLPPTEQGTVPRHILDLRAWRSHLDGKEFGEILGVHGYEAINDVPASAFPEIEKALIQRAQSLGKGLSPAEAPAEKKSAKPIFGQKPK